jgi:tRNA threonylcarbamoyladenosine biosynthesis protein TsaB
MIEYVLVIDTSSMTGLCALAQKDGSSWKVLTEQYVDAESSHSEILFMSIQEVLDKNKIKFSDLSKVVYCAGPGSFTGLRISYSAVKAFVLAQGIRAVGVSTLRALMYNLKDAPEKHRAVTIKGSGADIFAFIEDKDHKVVLAEGSYDKTHVQELINGFGNDVAHIEQGKVTAMGMLSLLEDHTIDGINYLKASYAEKGR